MSKKLEVIVTDSGVQFGGAWFSHESITGYTAEQLNSGDCHVTGNQYMQWLSQDVAQSELAALREELTETQRISQQEELRANGYATQLVAAEQRNAELESKLHKLSDFARRAELIRQTRYFAAGLVENAEPMHAGGFENLTEDEHDLVHAEMQKIGKRTNDQR